MKRLLSVLVCGLLMLNADLLARGSSSSVSRSSSSSSRPSSSFSSSRTSSSTISKPSTPAPAPVVKSAPAPAPAPVTSSRQSSSVVGAAATGAAVATAAAVAAQPTTTKPTAVAPSALTQNMQKQDAMGTKAYSSQAHAQTAVDQQKAAAQQAKFSNTFTSEPATRPSYIPGNVQRGNVTYNVIYHGNQYGYYDNTGLFVALLAADAIADAQRYDNYANQPIAQQQIPQQVQVNHHNGANGFLILFLVIIGLFVVATIIYFAMRS